MPKQQEISLTHLICELKKRPDVFCESGSLVGKSSEFWKNLKSELKLHMLPQSLYLLVYKNKPLIEELRHHFKTNNIQENNNIQEKEIASDLDPDYCPSYELKNPYNCEKLEFNIVIPSTDLIECLKSKKKKEGWTDKIREKIWKEKYLPCAFALHGYITSDKFKFFGNCSDCQTGISGNANHQENCLQIHVKTFKTHDIPHSKKIKLQGLRRRQVKQRLCYQTATNYREMELEKVTTNYEPPHLNTTLTLRKTREEALDELLGYKVYKGMSITNQKFIEQCNIKKLSLNPFYIIYFSKNQLNFWNQIQDAMLPLSFDDTGGLAQKYNFYPGIKSKTLFYYVIVVGISGKIVPLVQALLSIHHVPVIQDILDRWIEAGAKVPKEICTDGSLALQNAICLSFNKMSFTMYNTQCFKVLVDKEKHQLPHCYYRHDIAHLLKAVSEWKCLKQINEAVKHFYLRSIGYLSQVDTLDEFVDIVESILITANWAIADNGSKSQRCLARLMKLFKTYKYTPDKLLTDTETNYSCETRIQPQINNEPESENCNSITMFIDNLFVKILSDCPTDDKVSEKANFYYCPQLTKLFQGLCYSFPSWTNCMKMYFSSPNKVGTSARSETNFKNLKSCIKHPLKVQKFVLKDNKRNESLIKASLLKLQKKEHQQKCKSDIFDLPLNDLISFIHNQ